MLVSTSPDASAVRLATADVLEKYVAGSPWQRTEIPRAAALEETFFLGLRLNRGVNLRQVSATFGQQALENLQHAIARLITDELIQQTGDFIRLTSRGRLLSNEVFQSFLAPHTVSRSI
jgi:oxygen-independent coproporphyrinogen-3 oxidase